VLKKTLVFFSILLLFLTTPVQAVETADKSGKCRLQFVNTVKLEPNLESFSSAMTRNLFLTREQAAFFQLYRAGFFGDMGTYTSANFNTLMDILDEYPELSFSKEPLREQFVVFEKKIYKSPESLNQFIISFKRTYAKVKGLFSIEANLGVWKKLLSFKERESQDVEKYLSAFLSSADWDFLKDSSKSHKEKVLFLYEVLNQIREEKLKSSQEVQKISQAMLDLVHTAGFGELHLNQLTKSKSAEKRLEGLHKILDRRDAIAIELGFEGHFSEMEEFLKVHPSHLIKRDNIYDILREIERDFKKKGSYEVENSQEIRVRALSIQESPYRGCLGGWDCSSNTYFEKALDPNFYYFTMTDAQNISSGQITVVLGTARSQEGERIKTAFVDKIQNVRNEELILMLEAVRRSLEEKGYKLGLPQETGGEMGLSNLGFTREYIKEWMQSQNQKSLEFFEPHASPYKFEKGYSRAYDKLSLFEFEVLSDEGAAMRIRAGSVHPFKTAPELDIKNFYEKLLSLSVSKRELDQIHFLNQLVILHRLESFPLSERELRSLLEEKLRDRSLSFNVRKKAFFTTIEFYVDRGEPFGYKEMMLFLDMFSVQEEKAVLGEMSNWRNSWNPRRRAFIAGLIFKEEEESVSILRSERLGLIVDLNAVNRMMGEPALVVASRKGQTKAIKLLIEKGADVNAKDDEGNTALMWTSFHGNTEIAKLLIEKAADINAKDNEGKTALMWASFYGKTETAELLIEKGADINIKDNEGDTALMVAGSNGEIKTVKLLIEKGADIHEKDKKGKTTLIWAILMGESEIAKFLIEKGADVNAKDNEGKTALMSASFYGNTEIVKLLIEKGADINAKYNEGKTALMWTILMGQPEVAKLLIEKGADVNAKDKQGNTALMWVGRSGKTETVAKLLIEYGTDLNAKDNEGKTALMWAILMGQPEIAKLLIEKGTDVNAKDKQGNTVLMWVGRSGKTETVAKLLIEYGMDVNAKDNEGKTALMWVILMGEPEIAKFLIEKDADVNAKDNEGKTALMWASFYGKTEIVKLLIEKGADVNAKDYQGNTALMLVRWSGKTKIVKLLIEYGADI